MPNARKRKEAQEAVQEAERPQRKEAYLSGERLDMLDPLRVLVFLPLRPYHTILDVYCGSGQFSIPLAKSLFDGKVYAVDPDGALLEALKKKAQEVRLTNIESQQGEVKDLTIPPESLDGALLALVLSEVRERETLLQAVLERLKKGGWAAIVEWAKKETPDGPPLEERVGSEEVMELAKRAGFRFSEKRDLTSRHYLVIVRK